MASSTTRVPEDKEEVVQREETIYGREIDDMLAYYRRLQGIMEELGFDEIDESRTEHWENLPFKQTIYGVIWKDPFTKIQVKVKSRLKSARADRRVDEGTLKAVFFVSGYVVRTRYPHWEYFEESSWFHRSKIYKFFRRILDSFLFRKEWKRYKEECEEITVELVSRMRKLEGSLPAIGRSKREWFRPQFREER